MRIVITETVFNPTEEVAAFEALNASSGAVATFTGRCRAQSNGRAVRSLDLQHYPGFTEAVINEFAVEVAAKLYVDDMLIIHRVGAISPGEPIVLVAACSAHRVEALRAVEMLIDFLKTDAPLWKHETTKDGAHWVEPTAEDHRRRNAAGQTP